jgi:rubrerythrin
MGPTTLAAPTPSLHRAWWWLNAFAKMEALQIPEKVPLPKTGTEHGIFEETADQEKEHAKRFFKFLEGGEIEVVGAFPAGVIGTTLENLNAAAAGEHYEHTEMYPGFATVARGEGFDAVAMVWEAISVAEKQHEKRYLDLAANIQAGTVFKREQAVVWRCRNCGYLHEGLEAPEMCPACAHPRAHFELLGENW